MSTTAQTKEFFNSYIQALSGQKKTAELVDRFVSDPALAQHILQTEAAFPDYRLTPQDVVVEEDRIAIRATMDAVHKGPFAGIEPTGRSVSIEAMVFYQVTDGRISKFWMQLDLQRAMEQLKG